MEPGPTAPGSSTRGLLRNYGSPAAADRDAPLQLDHDDGCWVVLSGQVDLFSVSADEGATAGRRRHLCRVEAGGAFFGMQVPAPSLEGVHLVAVSVAEADLLHLDRTALAQVALQGPGEAELVSALLAGWVRHLYAAVDDGSRPAELELMAPGQTATLAQGQVAGLRPEQVVWLRQSAGATSVTAGAGTSAPLPTEQFFPLSAPAWLRAEMQGTSRVEVVDTRGYLDRDSGSLLGLTALHAAVLPMLALRSQEREEARHRRVVQQVDADRRVATRALRQLGSVTRRRRRPGPESVAPGSSDALFAACRDVAASMGVSVRRPVSVSTDRAADPVEQIARASEVRVRPVVLRDDWWRQDAGPLLAFVGPQRRPVALLPEGHSAYLIVDPADDTRVRVDEEAAATLHPTAYTFYRPLPNRALSKRDLWAYSAHGVRADLLRVVLLGIVSGALGALVPIATQQLVETAIPLANVRVVLVLAAGLVIGALAAMLFNVVSSFVVLRIETRLDASLQAAVWDRLLSLPVSFFKGYSAGDLAARATGINTIRQLVAGSTISSVLTGVFSVFSFGVVFYYSATLGLLSVLMISVIALVTVVGGWVQLRYSRLTTQLAGEVSSLMLQLLSAVAKLRVAGAERRAFGVWAERYARQRENSVRSQAAGNALIVFGSASGVLTSLVVFAFVAYLASGELDTSDFVAFNVAFAQFLVSAAGLTSSLTSVLSATPYYERAKPILEANLEVEAAKPEPGELSGRIHVSHVSLRYDAASPLVLDDVSLRAEPGEFVAVVGPSGAGKSSLLRVLLGFEEPEMGGVYYDDHELSAVDVRAVRRQMGVVLQDGKLMPGPIFTNIVGVSSLTMEDAWETARLVGMERDIDAMPMGMLTILGEGAKTISGGQRQRLLIARAIARKPRVVLLDEATSALDNRTQAIVSASLENLQMTRIVIAHRLSTIVNADRIYVLDGGRLVQSGTYEELVSTPGAFARLATRQIA